MTVVRQCSTSSTMDQLALVLCLLLSVQTRLSWATRKPPCVVEVVNGLPTTWYEKMVFQKCTKQEIRGFARGMNQCLIQQTSNNQRDLQIKIDTDEGNSSTLCRALDGVASCYTMMFSASCLVEQEREFFKQEYRSTKSLLSAFCNGSTSLFDRLQDGSIDCLAKLGMEHTCCEMEAAKDLLVAESTSICRYFTKTITCMQKYLSRCSDHARDFLGKFLRSEEFMVGCDDKGQDDALQQLHSGIDSNRRIQSWVLQSILLAIIGIFNVHLIFLY